MASQDNALQETRYASFRADGALLAWNAPVSGKAGTSRAAGTLEAWVKTFAMVEGHRPAQGGEAARLVELWRQPGVALNAYDDQGRHYLLTNHDTPNGGSTFVSVCLEKWRTRPDAYISLRDAVSTINTLDEALVLWKDGCFMLCNRQFVDRFDLHKDKVLRYGYPATDFVDLLISKDIVCRPEHEDREAFRARLLSFTNRPGSVGEFTCTDGRVLKLSTHQTAYGSYCCRVQDISDTKEKEQRAKAMAVDAMQALDMAMVLFDADLNYVFANQHFLDLFFTEGEPRAGTHLTAMMRSSLEAGTFNVPPSMTFDHYMAQIVGLLKDYRKNVELNLSGTTIFEASSHETSLGGYLITLKDITAEQNAAKRAQAMLVDALQALDEGLILFDKDLNFVFANRTWYEIFDIPGPRPKPGLPLKTLIERLLAANFFAVPEGETHEHYRDVILAGTKTLRKQVPMDTTAGRYLLGSAHETGLGGYLLSFTDVTEQRRTEQFFLAAMERLPVAFGIEDVDGTLTHANRAYGLFMGRAPETLVGRPSRKLMEMFRARVETVDGHPVRGDAAALSALLKPQGRAARSSHEIKCRNGRYFQLEYSEVFSERRCTVMVDITAVKDAERKGREAVTDAIQATEDTLVLFDQDLNFMLANEKWFEVHYTNRPRPHPGQSFDDLFSMIVNDDFYVIPDGVSKAEFVGLVKQAVRGYARDVTFKLTSGKVYIGGSHRTALGGYLLSSKDITERVRIEKELSEQRELAHRNEKLSALGELLAGVAHELNNPLSVVFGYAQMLQGKVSDPVVAERLELIRESAERSAKIVKMFLAMARQQPSKVTRCSLNEVLEVVDKVSCYSLRADGTKVTLDLEEDLPAVSADFDQLAQVFSNLVVNAGHALKDMRDAGALTLRSSYDAQTDHVVIEVRDNGPGIPKDLQSRIFEPFFTTKDVGEGTGVGLAFCHRIIESHGGSLTLTSAHGKGASFVVRLRALAPDDADHGAAFETTGAKGQRRVLVVDDEEGVAQLICDLLSDQGYRVTKTTDPRDALRILEAETFDAVLSDFKMPDMDGQAFHGRMKVVAPECAERTGFITGDSMGETVRRFLRDQNHPYIEKPIEKSDLLALVERLCDAADGDAP